MRFVDILGAFLSGIIIIAGISMVVAPDTQAPKLISSFGDAAAGLVKAAKG